MSVEERWEEAPMRPRARLHFVALLFACASCAPRDAEIQNAALRQTAEQQATSVDPSPAAERGERPFMRDIGTLPWLSANSSLVFVGRLRAKAVERDARNLISTKNEFSVEQVIKGRRDLQTVTLTTFGGTIGDETLQASGMPEFSLDETYLAFCTPEKDSYDPVTANERGVFRVVDGRVFSYAGDALIAVDRGRLRFGEPSLGRRQAADRSGTSAPMADPSVIGLIRSVRQAAVAPSTPMPLDAFVRAIRATAPR
jgi:hypothetical protein